MKKLLTAAALGMFCLSGMAQEAKQEEGFVFTTVKANPVIAHKIGARIFGSRTYVVAHFIFSLEKLFFIIVFKELIKVAWDHSVVKLTYLVGTSAVKPLKLAVRGNDISLPRLK